MEIWAVAVATLVVLCVVGVGSRWRRRHRQPEANYLQAIAPLGWGPADPAGRRGADVTRHDVRSERRVGGSRSSRRPVP